MGKKKPKSVKSSKYTYLTAIILIGALGFGLYKSFGPKSVSINEISNLATDSVDLVLSPANVELQVGTEEVIKVILSAGNTQVTAVQLALTYDPTILGTPTFTQGEFLSNVLSPPKAENGLLTATFAVAPSQGGQSGIGTIATIKIKPIKSGMTSLSFAEDTAAVAVDYEDNVVSMASGTEINVTANVPETVNIITPPSGDAPMPESSNPTYVPPVTIPTSVQNSTSPSESVADITYAPQENSDSSSDYPYTQAELDQEFDPSQSLSLWQKILAFFTRIFGK